MVARVDRCPNICNMLHKAQFDEYYAIVLAILLQNPPLATPVTFRFHNLCNIRKNCCVASATANVSSVAVA